MKSNNIHIFSKTKNKGSHKRFEDNNTKRHGHDDDNDWFSLHDKQDTQKWFENISDDPEEAFPKLSDVEINKLKAEAKLLFESETVTHANKNSNGSQQYDYNWMKTIVSKGTVSDRIAANTLLVQSSPIHNLITLNNLINMAKVGKKNECTTVIETLSELFLTELLPPHRKLKSFESRPLSLLNELSSGNVSKRKSILILWYFEDQLKVAYRAFIQSLQTAAHDTVDANKEKAISALYKLLSGNPEQETILLSNLVNKLGDPSQKVASKTIYCLTQLLNTHPNMKCVVMEEIERLLFRSNVKPKAQYYGICFLTQILLRNDDSVLAVNLIKLYFSFFKACIKKGEIDTRLMAALLMGVNRAYPFAKNDMATISAHIETVYKIIHIGSFSISLQALRLLLQVSESGTSLSDRFYSALYKKLLHPELGTHSQHAMFLSLLCRALEKDNNVPRIRCFIKRLLQVCLHTPVTLLCGILCLISHIMQKKPELMAIEMKITLNFDFDDEQEEHYEDVKEEVADVACDLTTNEKLPATWFHCQNMNKETLRKNKIGLYDPYHRNPVFAGGEYCVYTELLKLKEHYHPSVSLFASKILQGEKIEYPGNPLQDFALSKFLDRFVFKNPKKASEDDQFAYRKKYVPVGVRSLPVNSANYLNTDESRIPVDELFLYRYLKNKSERQPKVEDDDDVDSVASDEFEALMDNLMGGRKKDVDFADEVGTIVTSKPKKGSKLKGSNDAEGSEIDDDDDDNDEEEGSQFDDLPDMSGDDCSGDDIGEDEFSDVEDVEFSDDGEPVEDSDGLLEDIKKKTLSFRNGKMQKLSSKNKSDVFVSADEFAEMLEETGASDFKVGSISNVSNKDNADVKQLKWEKKRHDFVEHCGSNKRSKRKFHGKAQGKPYKRKRK